MGSAERAETLPGRMFGEVADAYDAARGLPIVCVEPDPRMAEVLRRNTARYPRVQVDRRHGIVDSVSACRVLPSKRREQALADTARVLGEHGRGIDMLHVSDLFLARRR